MNDVEKLEILKLDLQMMTSANDKYLQTLLQYAADAIKTEGIKPEGTIEYDMIEIQYAAYLFRKRAGTDTQMPRFLRYGLNNMIFRQKGGSDDV